jgi:hypothetical protein
MQETILRVVLIGVVAVIAAPTPSAPLGAQAARWELVASIGGQETPDPDVDFGNIAAVAFLDDTTLVVADGMDFTIRLFSIRGAPLRSMGAKGKGPGEFVLPGFLFIDSLIHVFDPLQQREVVYRADGTHAGTHRIPSPTTRYVTRLLPLGPRLRIGITTPVRAWGRVSDQPRFLVFSLDVASGRLDTLGEFHSGESIWHVASGPYGGAPTRFGAGGAVAVRDSFVGVADGYTGSVTLRVARDDTLAVVRWWSLPGKSRPTSPDDVARATAELQAFMEARGAKLGRLELEGPPRWSVARRALVDTEGTVWVLNDLLTHNDAHRALVSADSDSERWMILRAGDVGPTVVDLPIGFTLGDVRGELLVGIHQDHDGIESVRVYRMR